MPSRRTLSRFTLAAAFLACIAFIGVSQASARTALAGPPWISIETPVNPYDSSTRDAFLLVHSFHHGVAVAFPVSGTAEGLVNGERRSVALDFTTTSRAGAYALRKKWGDAGIWTLVITVKQAENDLAQALVEIGPDGEVGRVRVPTRPGERNIQFPRPITSREIDDALRTRGRALAAHTAK